MTMIASVNIYTTDCVGTAAVPMGAELLTVMSRTQKEEHLDRPVVEILKDLAGKPDRVISND